MQKLFSLRSASSKLVNRTTPSLLRRLPYKTIVTKPSPAPQTQTHNFFSHFTAAGSCQSHSRTIFSGFLSGPFCLKRFFSASNHPALRSLLDARVSFLRTQFRSQNFKFTPRSSRRSWFQGLTANDMVLGLIVANVGIFILWRVADRKFMQDNFTDSLQLSLENFKSGRIHTLITSAFSHIDTGHIISNMIGLYFFGVNIGNSFGPGFLLKLYLAGAIGGSVFYLIHKSYISMSSEGARMWHGNPNTYALGASGAVNAIMLLNIFLFPRSTIYLEFIIPVPAILLGIFLIGKDTLRIIQGDSKISGSAHLGGAAVGAIAWALVKRGRI